VSGTGGSQGLKLRRSFGRDYDNDVLLAWSANSTPVTLFAEASKECTARLFQLATAAATGAERRG
jgi:hypothetical protein